MSFGINEFLSQISKTGAAKQNLFQVRINPPSFRREETSGGKVQGSAGEVDARHLAFRVDNVEIPGRTMQTIPYNSDYGPLRKIPYNPMYVDVTTSIIVSDDFRERIYFEHWQNQVVGVSTMHQNAGSRSSGDMWTTGYYNDYVGNMVVETFDETGKPGYLCSMEECYPMMMNALPASWASTDVHKLQITWAYRYFRDKNSTIQFASDVKTGGFFNKSGLGALVGVGAGALAGKLGPTVGGFVGGGVGLATDALGLTTSAGSLFSP